MGRWGCVRRQFPNCRASCGPHVCTTVSAHHTACALRGVGGNSWNTQLSNPLVAHPLSRCWGTYWIWGDGVQSARQVVRRTSYVVRDGEVTHPMSHRLGALVGSPTPDHAARHLLGLLVTCGYTNLVSATPWGPGQPCSSPFALAGALAGMLREQVRAAAGRRRGERGPIMAYAARDP